MLVIQLFEQELLYGIARIVGLLVAIAYYTLAERKLMAAVQRRMGPMTVGLWGLLQPLADGLKLLGKELILPAQANKGIFMIAPLSALTISLAGWALVPFALIEASDAADLLEFLESWAAPTLSSGLGSAIF